jgi:hypothetical protein
MSVYNALIALSGTAISLTDPTNGVTTWPANAEAWHIEIEPLRGNAAAAYVGLSNVTSNGTGISIQELMAPASGKPLDRFIMQASGGQRDFDPGELYVNAASGSVKITLRSA